MLSDRTTTDLGWCSFDESRCFASGRIMNAGSPEKKKGRKKRSLIWNKEREKRWAEETRNFCNWTLSEISLSALKARHVECNDTRNATILLARNQKFRIFGRTMPERCKKCMCKKDLFHLAPLHLKLWLHENRRPGITSKNCKNILVFSFDTPEKWQMLKGMWFEKRKKENRKWGGKGKTYASAYL